MLRVIDDAELTGGNTMDRRVSMNHIAPIALRLEACRPVFRRMPYLQRDALWRQLTVNAMEIVYRELLLIGRRRVVAVTDVEDVLDDVLLDDEPRSAAEAHTLALADGVEPQPAVLADAAARLQLDDVAGLLAEVAAYVVVVVDLA